MTIGAFDYRLSSPIVKAEEVRAQAASTKMPNRKSEAKKRWWAEKRAAEAAKRFA